MDSSIYQDIARRTSGDIYIGVVGPVRTGKSTFIKRFMETLVLPRITNQQRKERATDELPQSSAGRTIMTTEPKFIPEEAVRVSIDNVAELSVRMIDCVGYILPSSLGYIENDQPRMVATPWFDKEIPFDMAAEIGTRKVITEHSTIGLLVTTDGSIGELPREEYAEAEERVIKELKDIEKPFVVVLNTLDPSSLSADMVREDIQQKYNVPVIAVNCMTMDKDTITDILKTVLYEFPIREIAVNIPGWIVSLPKTHWLKSSVLGSICNAATGLRHIRELDQLKAAAGCEYIETAEMTEMDLGTGSAKLAANVVPGLFFKVLSESTGEELNDETQIMSYLQVAVGMRRDYEKYKHAIDEVNATGYGIVMPSMDELALEEPEIVRQGGKYGVRLKASAPSIHMLRADIKTEVSPIVGSEKQSEELVMYLLRDYEQDPSKIWQSNIFGKSLHELVNEGLHTKLLHMPPEARMKLQETVQRIINDGCGGLICIIL